jgi:peptidoglycan/xylan/chitin deacetylase (PgdA/CDA1 family)
MLSKRGYTLKSDYRLPLILCALLCLMPGCQPPSITQLPVVSQFVAPSPTPTPLPTATWTPSPTAIPTSTFTATPSPTPTSTSTPSPTATLPPANPPSTPAFEIARGDPERPWMALTFDAGASLVPWPSILETLRQKDVQCTFFLTGDTLRRPEAPDLLRQTLADGHELANHSDTHRDFRELTDEEIAQELAAVERMVAEITGTSIKPYFRPPSGARDERVWREVQENGYLNIYWTYQVWDWTGDRTADEVYQYSVDGACNGAIVVMHVGAQETADALPAIIDELRARGYRLVTLSELLAPIGTAE